MFDVTKRTGSSTYRVEEIPVKTVIDKAAEVISITAHLYRELTVSALSLIPRRG